MPGREFTAPNRSQGLFRHFSPIRPAPPPKFLFIHDSVEITLGSAQFLADFERPSDKRGERFLAKAANMRSETVGRPMEILLVEDNRMDAHFAIRALERAAFKHRCTLVVNGEEAIQYLHREG